MANAKEKGNEARYCYDLLKDWKTVREDGDFTFVYPKEGTFYPYGFEQRHSGCANLMDFAGIFITANVNAAETMQITVGFADGKEISCEVPLAEGKAKRIRVSFADFPMETSKETPWQYVKRVTLNTKAEILSCRAQRRAYLFADFPVKGKAAGVGEAVVYEGRIINCSEEAVAVTAMQLYEGWESVKAGLQWGQQDDVEAMAQLADSMGKTVTKSNGTEAILLQPGESRALTISFQVHDYMVPGGHETSVIRFRVQGSNTSDELLKLKTMRSLEHPYIYHNTEGWQEVKKKINQYDMYQPAWREYLRLSEEWEVTDPIEDRDYCYLTQVEHNIMATAYCYALTGEEKYAKKLLNFFRRFSDGEKGYPYKKKGCNQSYVQEGHFFQHIAIAYDIVYNSASFTKKDHEAIEYCLRLYMEILDNHIRSGHISNWLISEIQGAIYCAMVLQDVERIDRFVFGKGGNIEQFTKGIFNDGWWHECSMGYNTWVSSMMLHIAHALKPFGYDIVHQKFAVPFNKEVSSTYALEAPKVLSGMYNRKWGGNCRNAIGIKDMFDATLPFLDYRGVMFGVADSDEKKLSGVHWGSTYDLAYTYYKDKAYVPIMKRDTNKDPIFGHPNLPDVEVTTDKQNAYSDNIGIVMLRSQKPERAQSEQIQAVLRYGSHGGAHGHFDICDLLSVMRYGRSFFNPENCWWGYGHFMYKFYVQCSLTKNMVVVDDKMQVPADSRRFLFHRGKGFQATGVETSARWSYPPYGGMVYYQDGQTNTKEELRKRCKMNACYLPIVEDDRKVVYGEMTDYTEPVLQKRIMVVTDDYVVLFDYLEGAVEHTYDSLMQIKGFRGIEGEKLRLTQHTEQMSENPLSDAQFITDCSWYEAESTTVAHFETIFTEEMSQGDRKTCDRTNYNEPGVLKMDVHTAWPKQTEQMVGRVAVYSGWAADGNGYTIPLEYRVEADGHCIDSGSFDAWILGRGECDVDIAGVQKLTLAVKNGGRQDEAGHWVKTPQALFWGQADIVLRDGKAVSLSELEYTTENIDAGYGVGRDYQGGRVTIVGTEYPNAIPTSPVDHSREGYITIDLSELDAVRFVGCIGCDAFPGKEDQNRRTYAVRSKGQRADFVTVMEPFETDSVIESVESEGAGQLKVILKDGRVQAFRVTDMEERKPQITMESWEGEQLVSVEATQM